MTRNYPILAVVAALLSGCAASTGDVDPTADDSDAITASEQSSLAVPSSAVKILMDDGVNFCTGVLVNESYALTARHCVTNSEFPSWKSWKVVGAAGTVDAERAAKQPDPKEKGGSIGIGILKLRQPLRAVTYPRLAVLAGTLPYRAYAVGRKEENRDSPLVVSKLLFATRGIVKDNEWMIKTRCYSAGGDSGGGLYLASSGQFKDDVVVGFEEDPEGWCGNPDRLKSAALHDLFTPVDESLVRLVGSLPRLGSTSR